MSDDALLPPEATLRAAFATLERGALKIVLVVDGERRLLGTVTDGDLRRGLLRGLGLDASVSDIMNVDPATALTSETRAEVLARMRRGGFRQMPLLDASRRVVDVVSERELATPPCREEAVVLMAGGLGKRLRPLTDYTPKPMLRVGGRPILETIVERFAEQGFRRFFISVNYRAQDIVAHFGDGKDLGVDIRYVHEDYPSGTAGALALLPESTEGDLIVMNGDILTKLDFARLLDFHREHRAGATVCVREYDFRIPYGVVEIDDHRMVSMVEKPVQRVLVNAGIYAVSADALALIPRKGASDMPDLLSRLCHASREVAVFPISEYWIDIGRLDDLERARDEFIDVFGGVENQK